MLCHKYWDNVVISRNLQNAELIHRVGTVTEKTSKARNHMRAPLIFIYTKIDKGEIETFNSQHTPKTT